MWDGLIVNIPDGWALCNGANGSPDMRERFVRGAPDGDNPGGTGGSESHTHLVAGNTALTNIDHDHNVDGYTNPSDNFAFCVDSGTEEGMNCCDHTHCMSICTTVEGACHLHSMSFASGSCSTLPSYYELLFIQKT